MKTYFKQTKKGFTLYSKLYIQKKKIKIKNSVILISH